MVDRAHHEHWGIVMEPVVFIDPFTVEEPASVAPVPKPAPAPDPSSGPAGALLFSSQGREREVQRLIPDLAVLATRQQHPAAG
jgi:hypothetical protein